MRAFDRRQELAMMVRMVPLGAFHVLKVHSWMAVE